METYNNIKIIMSITYIYEKIILVSIFYKHAIYIYIYFFNIIFYLFSGIFLYNCIIFL